ncbi:hypothetical protein OSB04_un000499 [Centaurea solstitialis]|uniref:Uncharacterized protein n=1 Tax=Centaurea solstitialis TaxID=347529 RepID=A0AA38S643_9ASTR|nr:hypothetical protein OSB04_un000499 [Centaurea solstitialis]
MATSPPQPTFPGQSSNPPPANQQGSGSLHEAIQGLSEQMGAEHHEMMERLDRVSYDMYGVRRELSWVAASMCEYFESVGHAPSTPLEPHPVWRDSDDGPAGYSTYDEWAFENHVMANTRSQTGAARGPPDQTASTADHHARTDVIESPPRLSVLGGRTEFIPRVNLEDRNPVITEVTPEMRIFDNVMKAVTEAMSKQQESFARMLEERDASHRRHEAVGENAGIGSGDAAVVVVTEETRMTGDKEKAKGRGCSYKNFLGCKPRSSVDVTSQ